MKTRSLSALLLSALCLLIPASLLAQPTIPIEQFDRTQNALPLPKPLRLNLSTNAEAPELYPGENADVGPQRILRLLHRKTYFEVIADSQYFFTDNPFLSDQNEANTELFVNTLQVAFAPEPLRLGQGYFAPALGFRSQWFNYDLDGNNDGLNRLDFNAQTAFLNARYQKNNWQFYAGFDFTRLVDQGSYDEAYHEYAPTFGIQRFFPVSDSLVFIVGAQFGYHATKVPPQSLPNLDVNNRYDGLLNVSCNYEIAPRLFVQPFYRFQYVWYPGYSDRPTAPIARNDTVNTFGVSLIYYFNKYVGARIFASYEMKAADYSTSFNYHKLDAGGGLSLNFRF